MHGWAPEVIEAMGKPETSVDDYLRVSSRRRTRVNKQAGRQ